MTVSGAKSNIKGEIPDELLFTPLVRCPMEKFQLITYRTTKEELDDTLERSSSAVANFVFPGLNDKNNAIIGHFGRDGINIIRSQFQRRLDNVV